MIFCEAAVTLGFFIEDSLLERFLPGSIPFSALGSELIRNCYNLKPTRVKLLSRGYQPPADHAKITCLSNEILIDA